MSGVACQVCYYSPMKAGAGELGAVRGNTERYAKSDFLLWKCPHCETIYNFDRVDFADLYRDYPLERRTLDYFARRTSGNLLRRLRRAGITREWSLLDYGCGNGVFLQFLKEKKFAMIRGYDPFVKEHAAFPQTEQFDCVVLNDVLEHCDNLRETIAHCLSVLRPGGILYIGTADSSAVSMDDLGPHLMRLHQPFHRIIVNLETLLCLSHEFRLEVLTSYQRSYMDTLMPFANYRFLDELNAALDHRIDRAFCAEEVKRALFRRPQTLVYGLLGYFFPSAVEPAVVMRKPVESVQQRGVH